MSGGEALWQALASTAVLGTQRKPFRLSHLPESLEDLLPGLEQPGAANTPGGEDLLLRSLAVVAPHRKAGTLPPTGAPDLPVPACPLEDWPRCSPQSGRFLRAILADGNQPLLAEWVNLALASRQRIREEHLEALFVLPRAMEKIRGPLVKVLGERGRWLARQIPALKIFDLFLDERVWLEGDRRERLVFFADLRERDPQRARELLASTWQQETPGDRCQFLEMFRSGLDDADEDFLEGVLDNGAIEARQAATSLLSRLPESRLVQRMAVRARALLAWKPGLLRGALEVTAPAACDAAMRHDGITLRPTASSKGRAQKLGEQGFWLAQVLACVPPQAWCKAWNRRPGQILEAVRKHAWEEALLAGWKDAAVLHQDAEWLEALMAHEARRGDHPQLFELFSRLPACSKEPVVIALLKDNPLLGYDQPSSIYLSACDHPWSAALTQAVTGAICFTLQRGDFQPWRWEKLLRDIPPCFHPDLLEKSNNQISAALWRKTGGDQFAVGLVAVLDFRRQMRKSFISN